MKTDDYISAVANSPEESLQKALQALCDSEESPKPVHRPYISLPKILLGFCLWTALCCLAVFAVIAAGTHLYWSSTLIYSVCAVIVLAFCCIKANSFVRHAVLIYQRYAPEKVRRSCLFTPTCSEYMLLAIEKHGTVRGVLKGLGRLSRCHYPNGGSDFP